MRLEKQRTEGELRLYLESESALAQYMILRGACKDEQDFVERIAPVFELIAEGCLQSSKKSLDELTREARVQLIKIIQLT